MPAIETRWRASRPRHPERGLSVTLTRSLVASSTGGKTHFFGDKPISLGTGISLVLGDRHFPCFPLGTGYPIRIPDPDTRSGYPIHTTHTTVSKTRPEMFPLGTVFRLGTGYPTHNPGSIPRVSLGDRIPDPQSWINPAHFSWGPDTHRAIQDQSRISSVIEGLPPPFTPFRSPNGFRHRYSDCAESPSEVKPACGL
jgi:hypothetical protein